MYKQDFEIIKGETFIKDIIITIDKLIYPLNNFTAVSEIRPYPGSHELTESFTCEVMGDIGVVRLILSSQQTNSLSKGVQHYDVVLINQETNERIYLAGGKLLIKNHVTELQ